MAQAEPHTSDFIIVGSGINSLVAAALLTGQGHSVCVLERNDWIGGCIKTEELTLPGFRHDVFSGFHPLFVTSPAYAELGESLHAHGLEYVNTTRPTAAVLPDGRQFTLTTSRAENLAALSEKDASAYACAMADIEQNTDIIFGLLGADLWKFSTLKLMVKAAWVRGVRGLSDFFGMSMDNCAHWLRSSFDADDVQACIAPWILHTGLAPNSPLSGLMGKLICFTLEVAGMPIVKGGSGNFVAAFRSLIESRGGTFHTGRDVTEIIVKDNQAQAVKCGSGEIFTAKKAIICKAIICNVTPTQLYGDLLAKVPLPAEVKSQAEAYHYGNGDMQIHLALDGDVAWQDPALNKVAMVHLTSGIDSVSRAINEAERGLLPAEATIVVAQPTALDASRAPAGKSILWLQLQELPYHIKGDAAGEIDIPAGGMWDEVTKEAYADRIIERLARHIPGLKQQILARAILSPRDLARANINLVKGDPYSGACGIEQFMLWRPLKATKNHATPVKGLYHIGASTHPGPGLGGTSGYLVAKELG
ncbi:FAD-dependent oxidoreductase [Paremcibacter congregatus]|uniref:Pyridine nucleotide-disulfide oxidoreductase domain-containing protein 2 n=2 Tax=Paremcibacter congregatus TaxID=2043170 RepID=A0A2G4YVH3_9PROT|nr:FAD-dependent oxidoreductase [Paremcibacter congregatus]QDE29170.1 NAD(P)/FAD-dependent oxidoreductase [Paremcibacter congregatus]